MITIDPYNNTMPQSTTVGGVTPEEAHTFIKKLSGICQSLEKNIGASQNIWNKYDQSALDCTKKIKKLLQGIADFRTVLLRPLTMFGNLVSQQKTLLLLHRMKPSLSLTFAVHTLQADLQSLLSVMSRHHWRVNFWFSHSNKSNASKKEHIVAKIKNFIKDVRSISFDNCNPTSISRRPALFSINFDSVRTQLTWFVGQISGFQHQFLALTLKQERMEAILQSLPSRADLV